MRGVVVVVVVVCVCVCARACVFVCACVCVCACVSRVTHTRTHAHTHTPQHVTHTVTRRCAVAPGVGRRSGCGLFHVCGVAGHSPASGVTVQGAQNKRKERKLKEDERGMKVGRMNMPWCNHKLTALRLGSQYKVGAWCLALLVILYVSL